MNDVFVMVTLSRNLILLQGVPKNALQCFFSTPGAGKGHETVSRGADQPKILLNMTCFVQ